VLGIGGRFAGAKGMVQVPDISGLTRSQAQSAITSSGLSFLESDAPIDTSNSSLDGKTALQSLTAGTLVDYETTISYSYYRYVAPAPVGPYVVNTVQVSGTCSYTQSSLIGTSCSGTTKVTNYTIYQYTQYRRDWSDGTSDYFLSYCGSYNDSFEQANSTECGYVVPTCVPNYQPTTSWIGNCINGSQLTAQRYVDIRCGEPDYVVPGSQSCCVSTPIFVNDWTSNVCSGGLRQTATRYRDSCTGEEYVVRSFISC
jgi:hypothetical protein